MHSAIEELARVMPPPSGGGDPVDWSEVQQSSGIRLPEDYRDFVSLYGGGVLNLAVYLETPPVAGSPSGHLLDSRPGPLPEREVERHPFLQGLDVFPFAKSAHGDAVSWICNIENPNEWEILVFTRQPSGGQRQWTRFACGWGEFLVRLIRYEISSPFSQSEFPGSRPEFVSWKDDRYWE